MHARPDRLTRLLIRWRAVPPLARWNLAGVLGLAAFVVGLAGMVGDWWVVPMVGGPLAVAVSYVASTHFAPATTPAVRPAAGPARADLKPAA